MITDFQDDPTMAGDGSVPRTAGARPLARGDVVGRYVVLDMLGRGGMGVVHAAYDPELDRKVALKLLLEGGEAGEARRLRMLREAQALARLSHPNVVTVHDVGTLGDNVWLAMEFVEGWTFGRWLGEAPRTWREIVEVLCQAGEGLAAAHRAGLVHRDFKPDNVMVARQGPARVMDFGLARTDEVAASADPVSTSASTSSLSGQLTEAGAIVGTPAYMSPEQLLGGVVDARSDQYSFCVTLHEALFGERPHTAESYPELVAIMAAATAPSIRVARGVPGRIGRILAQGLAPAPADRFPDMRALLDALAHDPRRTRAIAAGGLAAALVVGAAFGVPELQAAARARACEERSAAIDEVWNEPARARLGEVTTRSGLPYAGHVADHAAAQLDGRADAWRTAAISVCRAATLDRALDESLHARAQQCLEDRRDETAAMLEAYESPDAEAIRRLVWAVANLEPVAPCADPSALARQVSTPDDPRQREIVAEVRARLRRVAAATASGQRERALAEAREAMADAELTGHPPLVAAAGVQLGAASNGAGDYRAAVTALEDAFFTAGSIGAHDTMIHAATLLLQVIGSRLEQRESARQWVRLAEMAIEAASARGTLAEADFLEIRAALEYDEGRYDEAYASATGAIAIAESILGSDHPMLAEPLRTAALVRMEDGHRDDALALAERALALEEAALGAEHPKLSSALTTVAKIRVNRLEFAEARPLLTRALDLRIAEYGADHPSIAAALANLAAVSIELGDFEDALARLQESLRIHEQHPDSDRSASARTLSNIAHAHLAMGDADRAAAAALRSIALFDAVGGHPDAQVALDVLGAAERRRGRHAEAFAAFERELAIVESTGGPENLVVPALVGMARARIDQGRTADAIPILRRAEATLRGDDIPEDVGTIRAVQAAVMWETGGDRREAVALARSARELLAGLGHAYANDRADVDDWLAAHPLP